MKNKLNNFRWITTFTQLSNTLSKHVPLLFILFSLFFSSGSSAEIRYVSKTGTSIPPFTSWETAADSIQKCINICQSGDTVYVANGIYKEQIIMIRGLSLIGAGMDSCIIDSRELVSHQYFTVVTTAPACLLEGFHILVYNNTSSGVGIWDSTSSKSSIIRDNKISNAFIGLEIDRSDITIYKNTIERFHIGIDMFNSNSLVTKNKVFDYWEGTQNYSIIMGAYFNHYYPIIDSNFISLSAGSKGIYKAFGTRPTISNNVIILNGEGAWGIALGYTSDSGKVLNNLIIVKDGQMGFDNAGIQYIEICNNYLIDNKKLQYAFRVGPYNKVKNNVISGTTGGVEAWGTQNLQFQYNNLWNNDVNYSGFTPDSTNISVNPMVVDSDTLLGELDFHLQMFSPLIDAGAPDILDKDSTRSDIGLYGGPFGENYEYLDLAPRPPVNLTAVIDTNGILLNWNKNTEADFSNFRVYGDTTANFQIDSANLISEQEDTFFIQIPPIGIQKLYYKITAVDNQLNESLPSEELAVIITSVTTEPMIISDYFLYQNYPNPFNPSTKIAYKLKEPCYVKLYVYDVKGELLEVLVNRNQEAGYYEIEFPSGKTGGLSSGFYFYQIMISGRNKIPVFTDIKKMINLK